MLVTTSTYTEKPLLSSIAEGDTFLGVASLAAYQRTDFESNGLIGVVHLETGRLEQWSKDSPVIPHRMQVISVK